MDGYQDRVQTEAVSTVSVSGGDPGTADVSMVFQAGRWGEYVVELNSRVSHEDLPKLINDLIECVKDDERAELLARLTEEWSPPGTSDPPVPSGSTGRPDTPRRGDAGSGA
jgi:hypothetical protein